MEILDMFHPLVKADDAPAEEAGGEDVVRWDVWVRWIEPWLWSCVYVLVVNTPYDLLKWFGKFFWEGFMKQGVTYGF